MSGQRPSVSRSIRVLVVDEIAMRNALRRHLTRRGGMEILEATTATDALLTVQRERVDVVLVDVSQSNGDGRLLLRSLRDRDPSPSVIAMSSASSVADAVECIREGAFDYLEKPLDLSHLETLIRRSFEVAGQQALRTVPEVKLNVLYAQGSPMDRIMALVRRLAVVEAPVLVTGASGTGKELIAKAIHALSERAAGPLVAVNCAAIPENLIESELFGHDKGAFTGAERKRSGRFGEADGGTLFLDEVGELSPDAQSKLLRVLQDGSYRPVGQSRELTSDARIIAATNRNLEDAVRQGTFRQDLFYRLSVVPVQVPGLKDRGEADLDLLTRHFIETYNRRYNTHVTHFSEAATRALCSYDWPGNVRELEHLIQQQVILVGRGEIPLDMLPDRIRRGHVPEPNVSIAELMRSSVALSDEGIDLQGMIETLTVRYLKEALSLTHGNKSAAAKLLGLKRTTFIEKLKRHELH
jgi:DNA-binding NtrC family response regulator